MEDLPDDLVIEIGLRLDLRSLFNLGRVNRRFALILFWERSLFWSGKYLRDFGSLDIIPKSWKEEYQVESYTDIFVTGSNSFGELGIARAKEVPALIKMYGIKAKKVVAGKRSSAIVDPEGKAYLFGETIYGKLSIEVPKFRVKDISIGNAFTLFLDLEGNVWILGQINGVNIYEPFKIPNLKAIQIAAGAHHGLILDTDHQVWGIGENSFGQLGLDIGEYEAIHADSPARIPNLQADFIAAGGYHSLAIDQGIAYLFGSHRYGELGLGTVPEFIVDIPTPLEGIEAKSASLGNWHTIILDRFGSLWVFGDNKFGFLGIAEDQVDRPVRLKNLQARQVSTYNWHTLVIDLDHSLWVFGRNNSGQLGLITTDEAQPEPVQVPEIKVKDISTGDFHSIIIGKRVNF